MSVPRFMGAALDRALAGVSDEAELVAELRAGSEEAFAYLLGVYQNPIFNIVSHMVENEAEAADVLQDVFVKVFRGIRQFHEQSSLKTWMYRIAIRESLNHRRNRGRRLFHEPISVDEDGVEAWLKVPEPSGVFGAPDRIFEQAERQEVVRRGLASLAAPYRTVLILREIEDFSYEEIAQVLGMAEGTVKSRLKRGRELLKRKLEVQWGH